jgi:signal transduction histidine kinase
MQWMGDIVRVLRGCSLFADLTDAELALLAPLSRILEFDFGARIFAEGEAADQLYVLIEGKVALEMRVQFGPGKTTRLATAEVVLPGEPCGWSALVEPYVYTMSGVCLEPCKVVAIPAPVLREVLAHCPMGLAVMRRLAQLIAARARTARDTLVHALAILSHDLKAPLAAVESYNQVLLGGFTGPLNDEQKEMLERSSVRIKEMLTLISDLLDVSRIEAGTLAREFEVTNLGRLAEDCLAVAQALGESKGVRVMSSIAPNLPDIVAAPVRIQQAVTNLLSNAVKFTPPGGTVALTILDLGDQQQVEVIDTGSGVNPEDLPRIFDDFYTGRNVEGKGQGLGLSIAKKIVAAHGGRIWVESPYPSGGTGGSRFAFTIPKNLRIFRSQ